MSAQLSIIISSFYSNSKTIWGGGGEGGRGGGGREVIDGKSILRIQLLFLAVRKTGATLPVQHQIHKQHFFVCWFGMHLVFQSFKPFVLFNFR